jgi:hypothetical protein
LIKRKEKISMPDSMLTTIDNPYDPFTQFDEWYEFDTEKGYDTCSYLARIAITSDELSQQDEDLAIESAIDEIVALNVLGIYKKVTNNEQQ